MKHKAVKITVAVSTAAFFVPLAKSYLETLKLRAKRKAVLDEVGLDVAAIHLATDVINERIEKGDITSWDQLRDAVTNEVAFQKITIREQD